MCLLLVLHHCSFHFHSDLDLEGLFRVAPEMQEAKDMKKFFDTGQHLTNPAGIHDFSLHCAANVFKVYFRELPEPLIPFSMYDPLLQADARDLPDEELVPILREQMLKLPAFHKVLLRYTLSFFREVTAHADKNMMTANNISIVFAANVLRPKIETVETTLALPRVSKVFEKILLNESIWSDLSA